MLTSEFSSLVLSPLWYIFKCLYDGSFHIYDWCNSTDVLPLLCPLKRGLGWRLAWASDWRKRRGPIQNEGRLVSGWFWSSICVSGSVSTRYHASLTFLLFLNWAQICPHAYALTPCSLILRGCTLCWMDAQEKHGNPTRRG